MTRDAFMQRWSQEVPEHYHEDHRGCPEVLFWTLSYEVDAPYITELVANFLSISEIGDSDGASYRRAKQIENELKPAVRL